MATPAATPAADAADAAETQTGVVWVDNKKYTCVQCRTGHRVKTCNHWETKPMIPTNGSGRPSVNNPKPRVDLKCDCPKECDCPTPCKCKRLQKCYCTTTMYMLVHIPAGEREKGKKGKKSTHKVKEVVETDLQGKKLEPHELEEYRRRKQLQYQQLATPPTDFSMVQDMPTPAGMLTPSNITTPFEMPTQSNMTTPLTTGMPTPTPYNMQTPLSMPTPLSGCAHRRAVEQERQAALFSNGYAQQPTVPASTHGCSCGAACTCQFCPQHPNNATSHATIRANFQFLGQQQLPMNSAYQTFNPPNAHSMSCMGPTGSFALSHVNVDNPTQLFPGARPDDSCLRYPLQVPLSSLQQPDPALEHQQQPAYFNQWSQMQQPQNYENLYIQDATLQNQDWQLEPENAWMHQGPFSDPTL